MRAARSARRRHWTRDRSLIKAKEGKKGRNALSAVAGRADDSSSGRSCSTSPTLPDGTFNRKQLPLLRGRFRPSCTDLRGAAHTPRVGERMTPVTETTPSSSGMLCGPAYAPQLNLDLWTEVRRSSTVSSQRSHGFLSRRARRRTFQRASIAIARFRMSDEQHLIIRRQDVCRLHSVSLPESPLLSLSLSLSPSNRCSVKVVLDFERKRISRLNHAHSIVLEAPWREREEEEGEGRGRTRERESA